MHVLICTFFVYQPAAIEVWLLLEECCWEVFSRDSKSAPFGVGGQRVIRDTVLVEVLLQLAHQLLHVGKFGAQLHVPVRQHVTLLTQLEEFEFSLLSAALRGFIIQVTTSPKLKWFIRIILSFNIMINIRVGKNPGFF